MYDLRTNTYTKPPSVDYDLNTSRLRQATIAKEILDIKVEIILFQLPLKVDSEIRHRRRRLFGV